MWYCTQCGAKNEDQNSYCGNCGTKRVVLEDTAGKTEKKKPGKKPIVLIAAGIVLVLAIVAVLAVTKIQKPKKELALALEEERWEDALKYVEEVKYTEAEKEEIITECRYQLALDAEEAGDWETAAEAFQELDYKDSKDRYEVAIRRVYADTAFTETAEEAFKAFLSADRGTRANEYAAYDRLLSSLEKFEGEEFYDKQLGELAKKYLEDLEEIVEWCRALSNDEIWVYQYQKNLWPLKLSSCETLKDLYETCGLMAGNEIFKAEFVDAIDDLEYQITVIKAFDESFTKSRSQKSASGWYSTKQQFIRYTNDTGIYIPSITFMFTSYDGNNRQTEYDEVTVSLPLKERQNIVFDCNANISKSWNWDWYINF